MTSSGETEGALRFLTGGLFLGVMGELCLRFLGVGVAAPFPKKSCRVADWGVSFLFLFIVADGGGRR